MPVKLTPAQLRARATAYEEAAGHLELAWTEDPMERDEGDRLGRLLQAQCTRYRVIAMERELAYSRQVPNERQMLNVKR